MKTSLGRLHIHDEDFAPEEIYGALDGPLEDGKIHGVLVCVVEGDDPLPISQELVRRWNACEASAKTDEDLARAYQIAYDECAGPEQFRHSVNHPVTMLPDCAPCSHWQRHASNAG